jgi:pimeloyl-ACP methyl ester carboxylesterase
VAEQSLNLTNRDMICMCGSLGGYIAGCYALRYPGRAVRLLLVEPWGLAHPPAVSATSAAVASSELPVRKPYTLTTQATAATAAGNQFCTCLHPCVHAFDHHTCIHSEDFFDSPNTCSVHRALSSLIFLHVILHMLAPTHSFDSWYH